MWFGRGAVITLVLLLIGRVVFKMNYLILYGLFAGRMTDPPALAFANSQSKSSSIAVAYASVYPLVMILRIISVQVIVLLMR